VAGRLLLTGEIFLKGCHTCVNEQQGFVVYGNKGIALMAKMPLGFKEREVAFADLAYAHPFHNLYFPFDRYEFYTLSIIVFLRKKSRTFWDFRQFKW
jgi:hypothetical protein